jgi:hypothetical protein
VQRHRQAVAVLEHMPAAPGPEAGSDQHFTRRWHGARRDQQIDVMAMAQVEARVDRGRKGHALQQHRRRTCTAQEGQDLGQDLPDTLGTARLPRDGCPQDRPRRLVEARFMLGQRVVQQREQAAQPRPPGERRRQARPQG